jgi:molybdenum cofactor guanylyltransferase
VKVEKVFVEMQWDDPWAPKADDKEESWRSPTEAQRENRSRWFANLNTPEEFAEAEEHLAALDT